MLVAAAPTELPRLSEVSVGTRTIVFTLVISVSAEETIEMFAFMEAADESKRQGGVPVTLASVLAKAQAQAGN